MFARFGMIGLCAGLGVSFGTGTAEAAPKKKIMPRKAFKLKIRRVGSKSKKVSPPAPACTIKTSEILDQRIDIKAQTSLMRRLSRSHADRRLASSMFQAVKQGKLAGILLNWRKAVADRGARMSPQKGWWDLIPTGKLSTCLRQPGNEPPMIIFRKDLSDAQVDAVLASAWNECRLPLVREPCAYDVDLVKPQDDPVECKTDADCIQKGIGDFCNTSLNLCGINVPGPGPITPSKPKTGQRAKCFDQAHATWRAGVTSCENAEAPKLAKCALDHFLSPDPLGLAKCLLDSASEKESCKRQKFNEYEHKRKHVCPKKPV